MSTRKVKIVKTHNVQQGRKKPVSIVQTAQGKAPRKSPAAGKAPPKPKRKRDRVSIDKRRHETIRDTLDKCDNDVQQLKDRCRERVMTGVARAMQGITQTGRDVFEANLGPVKDFKQSLVKTLRKTTLATLQAAQDAMDATTRDANAYNQAIRDLPADQGQDVLEEPDPTSFIAASMILMHPVSKSSNDIPCSMLIEVAFYPEMTLLKRDENDSSTFYKNVTQATAQIFLETYEPSEYDPDAELDGHKATALLHMEQRTAEYALTTDATQVAQFFRTNPKKNKSKLYYPNMASVSNTAHDAICKEIALQIAIYLQRMAREMDAEWAKIGRPSPMLTEMHVKHYFRHYDFLMQLPQDNLAQQDMDLDEDEAFEHAGIIDQDDGDDDNDDDSDIRAGKRPRIYTSEEDDDDDDE